MTSTKNPAAKARSYESATVTKAGRSQTEIAGVISADTLESYRKLALKNMNETVSVDGFRKGMVPENVLVAKVGDMVILEEMSELALSTAYIDILVDNKIDAIGKPKIQVTKMAKGNPLEFKITTAIVPEVALPDYKKLAADQVKKADAKELEVTDKDVEDAILRVRRSQVSHEGHDHSKLSKEDHEKEVDATMPELTDDLVKKLGDFKDIPDFKIKLTAMVGEQKKDEAREKMRVRIADAVADATKADMPDIMIESELDRTQAQFEADIERMGVKIEDYLKHAKKSLENIRTEWRPHAEKKAKLQLILNSIAVAENIKPDEKEIEAEVNHIVEHYSDADRERASVYAETVLTNEKVFQFLEGQK